MNGEQGATPIFRPPVGLLDLLATKTLGKNPDKLTGEVHASIDLSPYYLSSLNWQESRISGLFAVGTGEAINNAIVPAGELHVIRSCTVVSTSTGGASSAASVPFIAAPSGNICWRGPLPPHLSVQTTRRYSSSNWWPVAECILPPGWAYGVECVFGSAGDATYQSEWVLSILAY